MSVIHRWVSTETMVLWLRGHRGAGKSTIARTIAAQLSDSGTLGGSFFFKIGDKHGGGNAKLLFPSLA
jgi:tRNA A37 threonylcarbamoyladenosine biosynthesis protein TsaE